MPPTPFEPTKQLTLFALSARLRLSAQPGIVQHRLFQRRAGRQTLDFVGKVRLERKRENGEKWAADRRPEVHRPFGQCIAIVWVFWRP